MWLARLISSFESGRAEAHLFANNGSEFAGHMVDMWAYHRCARLDFSRPGKPTDNAYIETFNGSLRDEWLNLHWFRSLNEAKELIEVWRKDYNESRPHMGLGNLTPAAYLLKAASCSETIRLTPVES